MKLDLVPFTPDTVIDVGANTGSWFLEAKKAWPKAHFILIDANEECRPALEALGVDYRIAVLSDRKKPTIFYTRQGSPACTGASYYREQTPFYADDSAIPNPVETTTLDQMIQEMITDKDLSLNLLLRNLLLKLDCQGAELDILKGGINLLSLTRAVITEVSFVEYNKGAPTYVEVDRFMLQNEFTKNILLGTITHPLHPELIIQHDVLYTRMNPENRLRNAIRQAYRKGFCDFIITTTRGDSNCPHPVTYHPADGHGYEKEVQWLELDQAGTKAALEEETDYADVLEVLCRVFEALPEIKERDLLS